MSQEGSELAGFLYESSVDDARDSVAAVLRTLADTQLMMLERNGGASERKNYNSLASVSLSNSQVAKVLLYINIENVRKMCESSRGRMMSQTNNLRC